MRNENLHKVSQVNAPTVRGTWFFRVIRKLFRLKVRAAKPIVLGVHRKGVTEWQYWPRINFAALLDMHERRITTTQAGAIIAAYGAALKHFEKYRKWPGYDGLDKILSEMRQQT